MSNIKSDYEQEKKYLIRIPNKDLLLKLCGPSPSIKLIKNIYLKPEQDNTEERIRASMDYVTKEVLFFHTIKEYLDDGLAKRIEKERPISLSDCQALLQERTDKEKNPVEKIRVNIPFGKLTGELDIYKNDSHEYGVLEIEYENEHDIEEIEFDKIGIEIIEDVTEKMEYKNVQIASRKTPLFSQIKNVSKAGNFYNENREIDVEK